MRQFRSELTRIRFRRVSIDQRVGRRKKRGQLGARLLWLCNKIRRNHGSLFVEVGIVERSIRIQKQIKFIPLVVLALGEFLGTKGTTFLVFFLLRNRNTFQCSCFLIY